MDSPSGDQPAEAESTRKRPKALSKEIAVGLLLAALLAAAVVFFVMSHGEAVRPLYTLP